VRGTFGLVGDALLNPLTYYPDESAVRIGIRATERINYTSLHIGEYEELKDQLSPYAALRNAYHQHREYLVRHPEGEGARGSAPAAPPQ
jgi:phospholipid-binding lipoprotein MlaA